LVVAERVVLDVQVLEVQTEKTQRHSDRQQLVVVALWEGIDQVPALQVVLVVQVVVVLLLIVQASTVIQEQEQLAKVVMADKPDMLLIMEVEAAAVRALLVQAQEER
jgi:hypothetical protein